MHGQVFVMLYFSRRSQHLSRVVRKPDFHLDAKIKAQISFAIENFESDQCLCSCYTIVQPLFFLNPKFQASCHLLLLHRPVYARRGRKPQGPVFSRRGSFICPTLYYRALDCGNLVIKSMHIM